MKMRNLSRLANDYRSTSEEGVYYIGCRLHKGFITIRLWRLRLSLRQSETYHYWWLFCVDQDVPEANLRHYTFMLQGFGGIG